MYEDVPTHKDKRETIRLFIKANSSIFRCDPFPKQAYKKIKHQFFEQIKSPVPKDSEIAGEIIDAMIQSVQIKNKEELDAHLSLPFFRKKLRNKQYYYERLELKSKQLTPIIDVDKLKKVDYSEKIRKELKDEAIKEIVEEKKELIDEWDERIHKKTEEYKSIPSILDRNEYPVPDIVEPKEKTDIYVPWWDKLGLVEDPFREMRGLIKIDESLYDKIIYKTEIFRKYLTIAESYPKELYRNTVVVGGWGSGKTTFFEYMKSRLTQYMIFPIYVQLGGELELRELIFDFRKKTSIELSRVYPIFTGEDLPIVESTDDEKNITELMKKLTHKGTKGFVIFIDDLHKGEIDKAMRFLSYLQILTSQLRRATPLNIGFFIACAKEWEPIINKTPKFSGSIDKQEQMPPLKIDAALYAINSRLEAFAKNPENPRQIEKEFLDRIYKRLHHNMQEITFRRVMREVVAEFEAGHFDALNANPIEMSKTTLASIRLDFDQNSKVANQLYQILKTDLLTPNQKKRCLDLLIRIYIYEKLPESQIREPDVPFLQRLQRAGLIIKVWEKDLSWRISTELFDINRKIIKKYNLSLEDYLLGIYSEYLPDTSIIEKPRPEEITQIEKLISFNEGLARHFLVDAKEVHEKILQSKKKFLDLQEKEEIIVNLCSDSLAKLTKAYMVYEKINLPYSRDALSTLSFWSDFWWSSEVIMQFVRASKSSQEPKKKIPLVMMLYFETFNQILSFFINEFDNSRIYEIPITDLTNDEIKLFHECRQLWRNSDLEQLASKLTNAVERKLRKLLFNLFTILYGDYKERIKMVDKGSRQYITQNVQKDFSSNLPELLNEFQNLNRAQYKNIMTGLGGSPEGRRNWKNIFSTVFPRRSERDLYNYLHQFAEINIRVSHLKNGQFGPSEQAYILDFIQKTTWFMMDANKIYEKLIVGNYFKSNNKEAFFSLCSFKFEDNALPIEITNEDLEGIIESFKTKKIIRLPIDDQEYVEGYFGLKYRKVLALLALLKKSIENPSDKETYRLATSDFKGPEIRMGLSRTIS